MILRDNLNIGEIGASNKIILFRLLRFEYRARDILFLSFNNCHSTFGTSLIRFKILFTFICCINFYIFMNILFNSDARKKSMLLPIKIFLLRNTAAVMRVQCSISSPPFYSGCTFLQTFYVSLQNCSILIVPEFLFMGERSSDLKGDGMHSSRADVKSKNEIFLSPFTLMYSRARLVRMNRARVRCIALISNADRIIIFQGRTSLENFPRKTEIPS